MAASRRPFRRSAQADAPSRRTARPAGEPASAYASAIRFLARRELSEAQLRDRLSEAFDLDEVDAALTRLRQEGAVDDRRVAAAHARTAILVKRRGRLRVERELEAIGVERTLARQAVDAALEDVDERALLRREVDRRVEGRTLDPRARARLYAQLLRRGFPADLVVAALGRHRPVADED